VRDTHRYRCSSSRIMSCDVSASMPVSDVTLHCVILADL